MPRFSSPLRAAPRGGVLLVEEPRNEWHVFLTAQLRGQGNAIESAAMNNLQIDRLVKAIVDGEDAFVILAERAEIEPAELVKFQPEVDRAISLMSGFYRFADEEMAPAGLPPPKNQYYNIDLPLGEQVPEYYAFEAVQRGSIDRERCVWTVGQFGLDEATAETAIDNVIMPWREANGWRTYAREHADGKYVLQNRPPVKIKRHLERLMVVLGEERE